MHGEGAPLPQLKHLLDTYDAFHLYIDDAHGMSWTGKHGRGYVRSHMEHHPKMVLVVSLNKSFAAAGGAVILPNEAIAESIRHCGGTLIFSGPIQPPMLGAACASARLHLSGAIHPLQQKLVDLIQHTNQRISQIGLPHLQPAESPIFFIPVGLPRITANLIGRVMEEGYYVNPASFPALPMRRSGVRFMVNANLEPQDVDGLLERLAYHYPLALEEEGSRCEEVSKIFRIPPIYLSSKLSKNETSKEGLRVEHYRSITQIDSAEWDRIFSDRGNFTASSLRMIENTFSAHPQSESRWDFHYLLVRDASGTVVLATFFTCALVKEDMFSPAEVSQQVEAARRNDPHSFDHKVCHAGLSRHQG